MLYRAMFERTLHTEIEIDASPARVWAVLTDFDRWSEWNSVLLGMKLRGPLQVGTKAKLTINLGPPLGKKQLPVQLKVVSKDHELTWGGGVAPLMVVRHGFRLEPTAAGTRVVHAEIFSGLGGPLVLRLVEKGLHASYERLNQRLRERCEASRADS